MHGDKELHFVFTIINDVFLSIADTKYAYDAKSYFYILLTYNFFFPSMPTISIFISGDLKV